MAKNDWPQKFRENFGGTAGSKWKIYFHFLKMEKNVKKNVKKKPSMSGMYISPLGDPPAPAAVQSDDLEESWAEASVLSVPGHRTK